MLRDQQFSETSLSNHWVFGNENTTLERNKFLKRISPKTTVVYLPHLNI